MEFWNDVQIFFTITLGMVFSIRRSVVYCFWLLITSVEFSCSYFVWLQYRYKRAIIIRERWWRVNHVSYFIFP